MADLFKQDGHLTEQALSLLDGGEMSELELLEISEHLSFCDECLVTYTQMLAGGSLMEPEQSITERVMARIRRRAQAIFVNKFVTMGVAASFAIIFWVTGVFSFSPEEQNSRFVEGITHSAVGFSQKAADITQNISNSIFSLFDYIGGGNNK